MNQTEMHYLWNLLSQTWGDKFSQQFGATPNDAWSAALAGVSTDAAKYALKKLIEAGSPFPPTLPELMVFARKYDRDCAPRIDARGRLITGEVIPALPDADPDKTRENLARLRRMLDA